MGDMERVRDSQFLDVLLNRAKKESLMNKMWGGRKRGTRDGFIVTGPCKTEGWRCDPSTMTGRPG